MGQQCPAPTDQACDCIGAPAAWNDAGAAQPVSRGTALLLALQHLAATDDAFVAGLETTDERAPAADSGAFDHGQW